MVKTGNVDKT